MLYHSSHLNMAIEDVHYSLLCKMEGKWFHQALLRALSHLERESVRKSLAAGHRQGQDRTSGVSGSPVDLLSFDRLYKVSVPKCCDIIKSREFRIYRPQILLTKFRKVWNGSWVRGRRPKRMTIRSCSTFVNRIVERALQKVIHNVLMTGRL